MAPDREHRDAGDRGGPARGEDRQVEFGRLAEDGHAERGGDHRVGGGLAPDDDVRRPAGVGVLDEPGGGGEREDRGEQGEPGQAVGVQDVPDEHGDQAVARPGGDGEGRAAGDALGERGDGDEGDDEDADELTGVDDGVRRDRGGLRVARGQGDEHRDGEGDGGDGGAGDVIAGSVEDGQDGQRQHDDRGHDGYRGEREGERLQDGAGSEHQDAEPPGRVAQEGRRARAACRGDTAVLQPGPQRGGDRPEDRAGHAEEDHRGTADLAIRHLPSLR
ncbi:hypothetical protein [Amycolatopsis sp. ATCC 39116]|uniref:hypothetical protein n=1 Tax=Amycolatopsis sp. (strain ATCC 39116 / 75iv2) TaxID=385957 RepID=UPI00037E9A3D|nr:hypothetical protein [Amycolatopsis sp. ATCC 39116]